jgi:peptide deformylase
LPVWGRTNGVLGTDFCAVAGTRFVHHGDQEPGPSLPSHGTARPAGPRRPRGAVTNRLVRDLTETLRTGRGVGLAAPQIGVGLRVFAFDVDGVRGHIVSPGLDFPDEDDQDGPDGPEGCMSFPGPYFDVLRRRNVVARGFADHGDPLQVVGTAEAARCLRHEADHLDGVLFIDRMDPETRKAAMRPSATPTGRPRGSRSARTRCPAAPAKPSIIPNEKLVRVFRA